MKTTVSNILSRSRLATLKKQMAAILMNKHVNTILPIYLTQSFEPKYIRERIDTPDGDFIDLDWVNKDTTDKPTVILFHGTEGNSRSHYAKRLMSYLENIGWRGIVPHFRGCSGELNRKPKFYHAGETGDIKFIIDTVKKRTNKELYAAGVSLGGNALLKYLGENQDSKLTAAFVMSVPFNLEICINHLDQGFNKYVYVKHFLASLLPKMKEYAAMLDNFNYEDRKIDTLDEFNNTYICQFFDFKNSQDYYQQANCVPFLKNIKIPTIMLQAEDDPMVPAFAWPSKTDLSPRIRFVTTKTGGHAGFVAMSNNIKEALLKLPKFIVEHFMQYKDGGQDTRDNPEELMAEFMEQAPDLKNESLTNPDNLDNKVEIA